MIRFLAEENMLKKWIPAGKFDSGSGNGFYSDSEGKSIFFYRKSGVWDKKLILGAKMAATFRHKKLSILSPVTPPPSCDVWTGDIWSGKLFDLYPSPELWISLGWEKFGPGTKVDPYNKKFKNSPCMITRINKIKQYNNWSTICCVLNDDCPILLILVVETQEGVFRTPPLLSWVRDSQP